MVSTNPKFDGLREHHDVDFVLLISSVEMTEVLGETTSFYALRVTSEQGDPVRVAIMMRPSDAAALVARMGTVLMAAGHGDDVILPMVGAYLNTPPEADDGVR